MPNYPFISIIIPAKNEEKMIGQCLESLNKLNYPKDKYEVIISDGLSQDRTSEIAQKYGAKVVKNEKQIVASGRNIGFKNSKGEIIAFSDADCVMDKNWLSNALKYFNDPERFRGKKTAGVGGPNFSPENETSFGRAVRFLFSLGSFFSGSVYVSDSEKIKKVKSIAGSNAIYKREALEKVMPTDETLLTCDDTDMNYHLREKGYKLLYVPDVVVWHYRRDNPIKFFRQNYRFAIGRLQLSRKYKNAVKPVHILFGLSAPISLFLIIFAFNFFLYLVLISALVFFVFAYVKEKSLPIAFNFLLAGIIFTIAWSLGFLRELIFPMKKVSGK